MLDVRQPYFDLIKNSIKTVEGRAGCVDKDRGINEDYRSSISKYKKGDTLRFTKAQTEEGCGSVEEISCKIIDIGFFASFEDMLVSCGLPKCLPNIETLGKGVEVYRSFPGYVEREKEFGVVGIHLPVQQAT